jgi:FkbM family methyltransferase
MNSVISLRLILLTVVTFIILFISLFVSNSSYIITFNAALRVIANITGSVPDIIDRAKLSVPVNTIAFPPTIRRIWINIGSHADPIVPPDDATAVIAVEPVPDTAMRIPKHPNIFVICAAIADTPGFSKFSIFHKGMSSSLAEPDSPDVEWAAAKIRGALLPPFIIVPVLTLEQLFASIPANLTIDFVKTDMQSYDLKAVQSASIASLRRVRKYQTEVYWCVKNDCEFVRSLYRFSPTYLPSHPLPFPPLYCSVMDSNSMQIAIILSTTG